MINKYVFALAVALVLTALPHAAQAQVITDVYLLTGEGEDDGDGGGGGGESNNMTGNRWQFLVAPTTPSLVIQPDGTQVNTTAGDVPRQLVSGGVGVYQFFYFAEDTIYVFEAIVE